MIRAGIIGQIAVGIIYGKPLADILTAEWQKTFLSLGYVGLILIIFEGTITSLLREACLTDICKGGLGARIDLLKQNFVLSMVGAITGVCFPIGLSYLLLYLGFGYGKIIFSAMLTKLTFLRPCGNVHYWRSTLCHFSW